MTNIYKQVDGELVELTEAEKAENPPVRNQNGVLILLSQAELDDVEIKKSAPIDRTLEIEAERQRRIYLIATPDAQAAAYRKSIALLHKGQSNWTVEDQAVVVQFEAANQAIEAIVVAADALIAMDPQPADFADNAHWPAAVE